MPSDWLWKGSGAESADVERELPVDAGPEKDTRPYTGEAPPAPPPAASQFGKPDRALQHEQEILRHIRERIAAESAEERDQRALEDLVRRVVREETAELPRARRDALLDEVMQSLGGGLGLLQPFMDDPAVTEIMVNRLDRVYVERAGRIELTAVKFRDDREVVALVERAVGRVGRQFDLSHPMVDARLPDSGARLNAVMPPLALYGTVVTIRKFPRAFTFDDLVEMGTLPDGRDGEFDVAGALRWAVVNRLNLVVSGGTGSGKTSTLNALSGLIPRGERLVFIEDAAELQPQQEHVIRLESRPPSVEGTGEVRIRELVRNALRMRPDRIIVGEVRGGETLDMLQAMNTGHLGSMTTTHANSPREAILRLETMALMAGEDLPLRAARQQIAAAVHLIVQMARVPGPDGQIHRVATRLSRAKGFDPDRGDVLVEDLYVRPAGAALRADVPDWAQDLFAAGGLL